MSCPISTIYSRVFQHPKMRCSDPAASPSTHIVIATHKPPGRELQLSPFWEMGMTNAQIYRYTRPGKKLPNPKPFHRGKCNVTANQLTIERNRGRDAIAFWDYAFTMYDNPPKLLIFVHHELPTDYHTSCEATITRSLWLYRKLSRSSEDVSPLLTLTAPHFGPANPLNFNGRDATNSKGPWFGRGRLLQEVINDCSAILAKHINSDSRAPRTRPAHGSCCFSFAMPGSRLRWYPRSMYADLRTYMLKFKNDEWSGRVCGEYIAHSLFGDAEVDSQEQAYIDAARMMQEAKVARAVANCEKNEHRALRAEKQVTLAINTGCYTKGLCRLVGHKLDFTVSWDFLTVLLALLLAAMMCIWCSRKKTRNY